MKTIAAAAFLALSLSGAVSANTVGFDDGQPDKTIVIYATSMEDAMRQIAGLSKDADSDVVIIVKNPDGTVTEARQKGVGGITVNI